jgi:Rrf2 family protein
MLSTRAADYALRGMLYLAQQPLDRLVMANQIATAEDMPEYFFSKILQQLAKAGLVNSFRGVSGGFVLARPPEEITVRDVIEAVEGPLAASRCAVNPESCQRSGTCPFHQYWKEAQASLDAIFGKYTLADAVSHSKPSDRAD